MTKFLKLIKNHRRLIFAAFVFFAFLLVLSDSLKKETKPVPGAPEERYFISSKEQPNFREAIFKPLDFAPNEEQVVYVKLESKNPIDSVNAVVSTDKKVSNFEFKLFEGNDRAGAWRGSWRINDTHNYTYTTTLKAVSGKDKSFVDLSFPISTKRTINTPATDSSNSLLKITGLLLLISTFVLIETGAFRKIKSTLTKLTRKD